MSTMIDKMARAIGKEAGFTTRAGWSSYRPHARAALEAMREVDEETFNAGWAAMSGEPDQGPGEPWLAIIDAILAEKETAA
tara:strand:+ start:735 stop:977 length:243 start_codon:yes stop_codon:yes gene_type:complete